MAAKIIKLDEYLENFRWSITRSVAHVMGLDPNDESDVRKADQMITNAAEKKFGGDIYELQTNLVAALENKDDEAVKDLLAVEEWTAETFNGVDVAEGYNFKCQVTNEVAKNRIMDWLEENNLDYLIDLDGRFAVKCPTRKVEYKVNRAFEHMMNKWDRGLVGKAVDPDPRRTRLGDIRSNNALIGELDEIAATQPTQAPGTFKPVEPYATPPLFPAKKKKRHGHLDWEDPALDLDESHYPDSEEGVRQFMAKEFVPSLSDNTEIVPDPSIAGVWLAIDHDNRRAWLVYLNDHDAEDVDYDEAVKKYSQRQAESLQENKKSKKKTAKKREKEAKEKLAVLPPTEAGGAERMMKSFGKRGTDIERIEKEKKQKEKKKLRQKIKPEDFKEEEMGLNEHVLGVIEMPTIGRIKELAGLSDSKDVTTVIEKPADMDSATIEVKVDEPKCVEISGLDLALNKLKDTFEVYKILGGDEKEAFRKYLIDCLMRDK